MQQDVLLVGSIPLDTAEEVFRSFGGPLGSSLNAMPDGEVGPRRHWISRIHYQVLSGHPELEAVRRPQPENGVERLFPRNAADSWLFKVKDGVERVRFGDPGWRLGYARDAINSYFVFKTLREQGVLPKHLRFQVSLPSVNSALPPRIFPNPPTSRRSGPASPMRSRPSSARIVSRFRTTIWRSNGIARPRCRTPMGRSQAIPPRARSSATSSSSASSRRSFPRRSCSAITSASARSAAGRVSHPPICPRRLRLPMRWSKRRAGASTGFTFRCSRRRDAFFAPLKELRPRGARVYLGVIHHMDGFKERIALARKYLPEFGLAAYCGFGRIPPADMPAVLNEHLQAIKAAG